MNVRSVLLGLFSAILIGGLSACATEDAGMKSSGAAAPSSRVSAGATTEINLRLLRVLKELGDVSTVLERIQLDGRLDSDEGRQALEQLRELLEAVVALQAAIAEASREAAPLPSRAAAARMTLPAPERADRRRA